mmetsp:Transcript_13026/g.24890  ORF Transcript_13026/g.24890 Transcript_13026/m.24890 type:complete len:212 (+) Transcript_13026:792-1427(+)
MAVTARYSRCKSSCCCSHIRSSSASSPSRSTSSSCALLQLSREDTRAMQYMHRPKATTSPSSSAARSLLALTILLRFSLRMVNGRSRKGVVEAASSGANSRGRSLPRARGSGRSSSPTADTALAKAFGFCCICFFFSSRDLTSSFNTLMRAARAFWMVIMSSECSSASSSSTSASSWPMGLFHVLLVYWCILVLPSAAGLWRILGGADPPN